MRTRTIFNIVLVVMFYLGILPGFKTVALAELSAKKAKAVYAVVLTSMGSFDIKLFHTHAPRTVTHFISLAKGLKDTVDTETRKKVRRKYYDGLTFHRVVPNFLIQGGDPMGDGTGGPGISVEQEIDSDLEFDEAGLVAMASPKSDKIGSQFFITLSPQPDLNRSFTIFGQVTRGMDVLKTISETKRDLRDKPLIPVVIKSIQIQYREK